MTRFYVKSLSLSLKLGYLRLKIAVGLALQLLQSIADISTVYRQTNDCKLQQSTHTHICITGKDLKYLKHESYGQLYAEPGTFILGRFKTKKGKNSILKVLQLNLLFQALSVRTCSEEFCEQLCLQYAFLITIIRVVFLSQILRLTTNYVMLNFFVFAF